MSFRTFCSSFVLAPLGLAALVGVGCSAGFRPEPVGPDYVSPFDVSPTETSDDPALTSDWAEGIDRADEAEWASSTEVVLDRWWQRLGDETLTRLVEAALADNLDVLRASARIAEARAVRDRVAGRELPAVGVGASVTERRQSENGVLPIDRIPGLERDQTIFDLGFDASWELDLFGRTRRALEAAEARLESAAAERAAVETAVAAEVARTYVAMVEGQRRLAALVGQVESIERTRELVELRVEAGEDARVDLVRVEADLRALEARLPQQRADNRAAALSLGVLVGAPPEAELALLAERPAELDLSPFPLGLRADVLRRRPDVRAAERRLAAATADIGLATAELYPRLSIGARGGFESLAVEDLFESSSVTWSIVPAISWRVFDGGRVRAEIRLAEARAVDTALAWEQAVLDALTEAERSLTRYRGGLVALASERAAVDAARATRDLERLRHQEGETALLPLLDAERRLDAALASLADTRRRTATDLVALYKALGGGWPQHDEAVRRSTPPRPSDSARREVSGPA